ncbi:hypothetical protein CEP54_000722 [Fusarium duplospermum]|uniref:Uncharacterized protein n=1 Tax=Fusarium duplospermum TaxID=1325734 RepID=A0A428R5F7_9HYPO|nr:hypothetical protein CEP54_000722 [Fusarium duplospermum]
MHVRDFQKQMERPNTRFSPLALYPAYRNAYSRNFNNMNPAEIPKDLTEVYLLKFPVELRYRYSGTARHVVKKASNPPGYGGLRGRSRSSNRCYWFQTPCDRPDPSA